MVSSTLIQIFIKGPIETVLYGNPQITFLKLYINALLTLLHNMLQIHLSLKLIGEKL